MKFYYWLDRDQFIEQPGVPQPLTSIDGLKRGTKPPVAVQFVSGPDADIITTVALSSLLNLGIKLPTEYDGAFLALIEAADWTEPSPTSQDPFYTATLNLNTTELNTAFHTPDGDATNDVATLDVMVGFTVRETGMDAPRAADELTASIANQMITGEEGTPTAAQVATNTRLTNLESQLGDNRISSTITGYTGGTSDALDSIVTTALPVGTLIEFATASNTQQLFRLTSGDGAENSPFLIRPDDFDISTNEKVWENVSSCSLVRALETENYSTVIGTVTNSAPADNVLAFQNSSSTGFTTHAFNDHLGNLRAVFGWGNSGSAVPSKAYWWVNDASVRREMQIAQVVGASVFPGVTIGTDGNITFGGALVESVQALSGAGAVDIVSGVTRLTTTAGSQALTLANGVAGQRKIIIHEVDGGSAILTPTTKTGYTTITFTNVGDSCVLVYLATRGWMIESIHGAVAA